MLVIQVLSHIQSATRSRVLFFVLLSLATFFLASCQQSLPSVPSAEDIITVDELSDLDIKLDVGSLDVENELYTLATRDNDYVYASIFADQADSPKRQPYVPDDNKQYIKRIKVSGNSQQDISPSGKATVIRMAKGIYVVELPELTVPQGVSHVTAINGENICNLANRQFPIFASNKLRIVVRCYDMQGNFVNSQFNVVFYQQGNLDPNVANAYLYAHKPTTASYIPALRYNYASRNGRNQVSRIAQGHYEINMPIAWMNQGENKGLALVTAVGKGAVDCTAHHIHPNASGDTKVKVFCRKGNEGLVDHNFMFSFFREPGYFGVPTGNEAVNSYAGFITYDQEQPIWPVNDAFSDGRSETAGLTHVAEGHFRLHLQDFSSQSVNVQLTDYGTRAPQVACSVAGWQTNGSGLDVDIKCFNDWTLRNTYFSIAVVSFPASPQTNDDVQTVSYQEDHSNFHNPERGFYGWSSNIVEETDLSHIREQGYSLVLGYIKLDAFKHTPLSQAFLNDLRAALELHRTAGIKLIPRFAYNNSASSADAPLASVLQHISQLSPIFHEYEDVFAVFPAGFIGAWGEWHGSSNGLDTPANKELILNALLDAIPESRMIQLRRPSDLMAMYPQGITSNQAFNGSDAARLGHHNDCFLASDTDKGTYFPLSQKDSYQQHLDQIAPWTPFGGETCNPGSEADEARFDCENSLAELARFRWDYINPGFFQGAIDQWIQEGCHDEITKRLGYRYRLLEAEGPESMDANELASFKLSLTNDGFGKLYNSRQAYLVLRHEQSQQSFSFPINAPQQDARFWLPQAEQVVNIEFSAQLPPNAPSGNYEALIHFPDKAQSIASNSDFSIRFANQGMWEAATGFNKLMSFSVTN